MVKKSKSKLVQCNFLWDTFNLLLFSLAWKSFFSGSFDWLIRLMLLLSIIHYTHCMDRYYTSYPFLVKKYILQQCKFWKPFLSFDYLNNLWSETSSLQWRSFYHYFILEFHNFDNDAVINTWYQIRHLLALSHFKNGLLNKLFSHQNKASCRTFNFIYFTLQQRY